MKICLINNLFFPGHYTETIALGLAKENDVIVIANKPFSGLGSLRPSVEYLSGIKVYRFYPLNVYRHYPVKNRPLWIRLIWHLIEIWNPHPYFVIKSILRKERPDLIHSFNLIGESTSVYTAIKDTGRPHVHSICDGNLLSPWASLYRNGKMIEFNFFDRQFMKVKRFLSRSVDAMIVESPFMRDIHLRNGYFTGVPFHIIGFPYRMQAGSPKNKDYSQLKILYIGNIAEEKGIFVLLDAFKQLNRNNVVLHFAGRGPDLEELKRRAEGIENVHLHGFVTDEQLADLYRQANITAVPSLCCEAGPASAFIESLPFGTPVVGAIAGGSHQGIIDGVNGRIYEPHDVPALTAILQDLIDNKEKLKKMEDETLKTAEEHRPEKYIASLLGVYRGLTNGSSHKKASGTDRP
jgi:glycosyltransferase involved in cell wall biosynthesis